MYYGKADKIRTNNVKYKINISRNKIPEKLENWGCKRQRKIMGKIRSIKSKSYGYVFINFSQFHEIEILLLYIIIVQFISNKNECFPT